MENEKFKMLFFLKPKFKQPEIYCTKQHVLYNKCSIIALSNYKIIRTETTLANEFAYDPDFEKP